MKFKGDYAVIETEEEAFLFGKVTECPECGEEGCGMNLFPGDLVPRESVLEAITPKKGEYRHGPIFIFAGMDSGESPVYCCGCPRGGAAGCVAVNALTIGKTVGELRELLEWCHLSNTEEKEG